MEDESSGYASGEHFGQNIDKPFSRVVNKILRREGPNTIIQVGDSEYPASHVRVRPDEEPGHLRMYVREIGEHKTTIAVIVVALGAVATGIGALKYRQERKK